MPPAESAPRHRSRNCGAVLRVLTEGGVYEYQAREAASNSGEIPYPIILGYCFAVRLDKPTPL